MSLQNIAQRISTCQRCPLAETRTGTVPGIGPDDAEIMFIGEGPGANEDKTGKPFSGPAGNFMDEFLVNNGIDRRTIFITNIVKCRPPNNRTPLPDEIAACREFLQEQIDFIKPKLIVSIGAPATKWFRPQTSTITKVAGQAFRHGKQILIPVMHPAAGLHKGSNRPFIADNFARIAAFLNVARLDPEPVQGSLDIPVTPEPESEHVQQTLF